MNFLPGKDRKRTVRVAATIGVIVTISAYLVLSAHTQTSTVGRTNNGGALQSAARPGASATYGANSITRAPRTGSSSTAVSSGTHRSSVNSRSPYIWPFSWNSIWNIPIASTAKYAPADIRSAGSSENNSVADYDSIDPTFPVVSLLDARLANGSIGAVSVYGDPAMTANGEWNTCSAFLGTDKTSVYQGQTTELTAGGNPRFGGVADDASVPVDIKGAGTTGCHGGSGLSGLGGTLTLADLTQPRPITHALKVVLDGYVNYSHENGGFRWPAVKADTGYNDPTSENYYGGSNPNVQEGSLLALPRSINPTSFTNPIAAKLAKALQDYGAYIVDTSASGNYDFSALIANYNASSKLVSDLCIKATHCGSPSSNKAVFSSQLDTIFKDLEVVINNTASTPGGGIIGVSRCALYAPQFTDGSDTPPTVTVINC